MPDRIADSLVLVFTFGMSLKAWHDTGMLERELELYRKLLGSYGRVVLVTYGEKQECQILRDALPEEERSRFALVCNCEQASLKSYVETLPRRVLEVVEGDAKVVVKTNQMAGGEAAVTILEALRSAGKPAALLARGGYLWSRFVTHEHGPHSEEAEEVAIRERELCRAADMVVGTTQDMVDDLAWRYGLDPARTRVIPNFVLSEAGEANPGEREPGTILYAGQLVGRKRVDVLIEAMARLPDDVKDLARLEIVGDGPARATLRERAGQLGAHVTFAHRLPHRELLARMARCTIYAQASDLEGHPKTVIEAMSTGACVVVADSPGLGVVVEHGATGLRVSPDPDAFARAFAELLRDGDWREMLGSGAARASRKKFALDNILPLEIEAHQQAMAFGEKAPRLRAAG